MKKKTKQTRMTRASATMQPMPVGGGGGDDGFGVRSRQMPSWRLVRARLMLWLSQGARSPLSVAVAGVLLVVAALTIYVGRDSTGRDRTAAKGQGTSRRACASQPFTNPQDLDLTSSDTPGFNFLAVGDWGIVGDPSIEDGDENALRALAESMGKCATDSNAAFVLNVGDNFYQNGISRVDDPRWRSSFEDVFNSPALQHVFWFSVLGNHDWKGNLHATDKQNADSLENWGVKAGVASQIAYTFAQMDSAFNRWCMPGLNFTTTVHAAPDLSVQLIMLDTQVLVRTDPDDTSRAMVGRRVPLPPEALEWLEATLCASKAKWKVVVGHHFLVSAGNYFLDPYFKVMRVQVGAILEKCGAHLYLHGHDHITQVIRLPGGTLQVGMGSAGKTNGQVMARQKEFDEAYGEDEYGVHYVSDAPCFAQVGVLNDRLTLYVRDARSGAIVFERDLSP